MLNNSSNILVLIELINSSTITFHVKRDSRINHLIYKTSVYLELSPYFFQLKYLGLIDIIANKYFEEKDKGERILNLNNTKVYSKVENLIGKLKDSREVRLKLVILKDKKDNIKSSNNNPILEYKDIINCSCNKEASIINRVNQRLECKSCSTNNFDSNLNFFKIEKIAEKSNELNFIKDFKRTTKIEFNTFYNTINSYINAMKSELYFVSDYCKKMMIINEIEYQINEIEKNINSIESNHSKINSKLFLSDEFLDYLEVCFHIDKQISSLFDLLSDKLRKQINLNKVVTLKKNSYSNQKDILPTFANQNTIQNNKDYDDQITFKNNQNNKNSNKFIYGSIPNEKSISQNFNLTNKENALDYKKDFLKTSPKHRALNSEANAYCTTNTKNSNKLNNYKYPIFKFQKSTDYNLPSLHSNINNTDSKSKNSVFGKKFFNIKNERIRQDSISNNVVINNIQVNFNGIEIDVNNELIKNKMIQFFGGNDDIKIVNVDILNTNNNDKPIINENHKNEKYLSKMQTIKSIYKSVNDPNDTMNNSDYRDNSNFREDNSRMNSNAHLSNNFFKKLSPNRRNKEEINVKSCDLYNYYEKAQKKYNQKRESSFYLNILREKEKLLESKRNINDSNLINLHKIECNESSFNSDLESKKSSKSLKKMLKKQNTKKTIYTDKSLEKVFVEKNENDQNTSKKVQMTSIKKLIDIKKMKTKINIKDIVKKVKENKNLESDSNPGTLCSSSTINSWKMLLKEPNKLNAKILKGNQFVTQMYSKSQNKTKNKFFPNKENLIESISNYYLK